jgi:CBS domain containing-hemolysin-like protein
VAIAATYGPLIETALGLLGVLFLIAATAVFVAAEFALVAADRDRLEAEAAAGSRRARIALGLQRRLSFHLSGAQLGITLASLVLGFVAEPTIGRLIEPVLEPLIGEGSAGGVSIALALAIATVIQMVVGELIPKNFAVAKPTGTATLLAPAVNAYGVLFGPVIRFLNGAANATVRRLGVEPTEELSTVRSLPELELVIRGAAEEGSLDHDSVDPDLFSRSVRFVDKDAADVLVPRTEAVGVSPTDTLVELVARSRDTGYSRFPVFGETQDDVLGVVHVKSVFDVPRDERRTTTVAEITTPAPEVPETMKLDELLVRLREDGSHLAVVLDEYGGTDGIVTLEDLLEELVGSIGDEHDPDADAVSETRPSGEFVLSGLLRPDEVEEACGFHVPEGPYDTLAGFAVAALGHIPREGDWIEHEGWELEVVEMDGLGVALVRLTPPVNDRD